MKDLEKKLDDFYIRADITHETSQIVIAELKNDKKYAESTVIQALKLSKTWFGAFMKNFGYGRRNVGSFIIVPELKIEEEIKIINEKFGNLWEKLIWENYHVQIIKRYKLYLIIKIKSRNYKFVWSFLIYKKNLIFLFFWLKNLILNPGAYQ